jgi:hypothetical protein
LSFTFQLVRDDEDAPRAVVFEDSSSPGLVPVWEAAGVYDALYNSDGRIARDVSRALAYGLDQLCEDAALAGLLPPGVSMNEAIRFLDNVNRGCTTHGVARIQTR